MDATPEIASDTTMKNAFIVTGDRFADDKTWLGSVMTALGGYDSRETVICIHGDAQGIDTLAGSCAWAKGFETIPMPYIHSIGRAGGPVRNAAMLRVLLALKEVGYVVAVHAFHDSIETSKGTKDMAIRSKKAGIDVWHYTSDGTVGLYA